MNLKVVISTFNEINPDELWLTFGTVSNLGIHVYLSMKLLLTWYVLSQCFMHLQHAILSQYVAEARKHLGMHGKFILKSSRVSVATN